MKALNVLHVEDNKGDAILLLKAVNSVAEGKYAIDHVTTLEHALKHISKKEYDVVLLDRSLPDVTGYDGLYAIQHASPTLPVIFITAFQDEKVALTAVEKGAQDYLLKDKLDGKVVERSIQYAMQRKRFEGQLITQANFDKLTGLANRTLYESRLELAVERLKRSESGVGIFFLDLNKFKEVNDTLGHAAGDELLRLVAERMKQSVRPYDTVARFGGDEFALLIEGIQRTWDCSVVAQKVIERISEPFTVEGKSVEIGVSIGITMAFKGEKSDPVRLLQEADEAMYMAKQEENSEFHFYTQEINDQSMARTRLVSELESALYKDELELYYQPIFDLALGRPVGAEALARWNHPTRGKLLPEDFLRVAEESRLIEMFDRWVFTRACENMKNWEKEGLPVLSKGINLSNAQLDDADFPKWLAELLKTHAVKPQLLALEVPASSLLMRPEKRIEVLKKLRHIGVEIYLDQFGVDAFSFADLQKLPVDALKICPDILRSAGTEEDGQQLIKAIIAMAHIFDMRVIASRVESIPQQRYLKDELCDGLQGHIYAPPMTETAYLQWMGENIAQKKTG